MPVMRIAFMGTPDFAVPTLKALVASPHDVVLVVTQPDRRAGRGRRLAAPAVKVAALGLGLPLEQHADVNTDGFLERLSALGPDVLVVVAFGQILRKELLELPRHGAVNVHASLLPKYRGTAPINWAIVDGEAETGVTTMFMAPKVDAGEIILQRKMPISELDTAGSLSDRLSEMGARLLLETLELIERGDAPRIAQDKTRSSYARKLAKADGEIDWAQPTRRVLDRIRGMTPWPGAYTWYGGGVLRVERAEPGRGGSGAPGEVLSVDDEAVEVATADGSVRLLEVCPQGSCSMTSGDFVRGYRPKVGTQPFVRESEAGA